MYRCPVFECRHDVTAHRRAPSAKRFIWELPDSDQDFPCVTGAAESTGEVLPDLWRSFVHHHFRMFLVIFGESHIYDAELRSISTICLFLLTSFFLMFDKFLQGTTPTKRGREVSPLFPWTLPSLCA